MEKQMIVEVKGQKVSVKVEVTDDGLSWSPTSTTANSSQFIKTRLILASEVVDDCKVRVHYANVVWNERRVNLRKVKVMFCGSNDDCLCLHDTIRDVLERKESKRPKKLLVFINPMSGSKNAVKIYKTRVLPMLKICGVQEHHIVTENAEQADKVLGTYDLDSIDAVFCLGGDGTLNQIIRSLIVRAAKESAIDLENPDVELPKPKIKIGSIPAGSASVVSHVANGSLDVDTSLLSFLIGTTLAVDVMSLRNNGHFVHTSALMSGLGMNADMFYWFEKLRWMGKARYALVLPICAYAWGRHNVEIDYLPAEGADQPTADLEKIVDGPKPGWKTYRGRATDITVIPYRLRDFYHHLDDNDYFPPDMATGKALLAIAKFASFGSMLKTMHTLKSRGREFISPDEIINIEVSECHVRFVSRRPPPAQTLCLNDGDALKLTGGPAIEIKIFKGLVHFYGIDVDLIEEARRII